MAAVAADRDSATTTAAPTERGPSTRTRPRLACTGLVDRDGGSVVSANFVVLSELLKRGFEVDFFSKRAFVYPDQLVHHPLLHYVDCTHERFDRAARASGRLGQQVGHAAFARRVVRRMREEHRSRNYDLTLALGTYADGRIPGVPSISWVQGPPETDARSVSRHRDRIKTLCGRGEYAKLRVYTAYRATLGRPRFDQSDIIVAGSAWSADTLAARYDVARDRVRVLPYPIDLETFTPGDVLASPTRELLWTGRVVPRKRLDLFLDAGVRLIESGRDVTLTVVGGFGFVPGFRRLVDAFPYRDRLTYSDRLPRSAMTDLLRRAAIFVQPSEEENFGSSVAEALACGTPVVFGPTNGTGEYADAGGRRFDEYDSASVADTIGGLLDELEMAPDGFRTEARLAAERHFAGERVVDQLEQMLHDAIARPTACLAHS